MIKYEDKIEQIKNILDTYNYDRLSACYSDADFYECFYNMHNFDDALYGFRPSEIARAVYYGEFCPDDDYFRFNANNSLESTNNPLRDDWVDINALAEYAVDCGEDFGDSDIQALFDQWDEEENNED